MFLELIWLWLTIVLPLQHKSFNFFVSYAFVLGYDDFSQDKRLIFLCSWDFSNVKFSPRTTKKTTNSVWHLEDKCVMYFISPFDFWVLSVQKIEFFLYSSVLFNSGWVFYFLCKTKTIDHSMLDRLQVRFSSPSSSVFSFYLLLHLYAFFSGYENSDKFISKDEL